MADPNERPWYVDPNKQAAIVASVAPVLATIIWLIYGFVNGDDGLAADDLKGPATAIATAVVAVLAILAARRRAFAPKTVAEGDPAALKAEAAAYR